MARNCGGISVARLIAALAAFAVSIAACALLLVTEPEPEAALREAFLLKVVVAPVQRETLAPTERLIGRLQPARRADLKFEVTGLVEERSVEPGMTVNKGDVLISLVKDDLQDVHVDTQASYEMEMASIERDRRLLKLSKKNQLLQANEVARLEQLGQKSLSSVSQLDAASQLAYNLEAEVARLQHSVDTAGPRTSLQRSARDRAKRNLQRTELKAPFAGTINSVAVDAGDTVSINDPVLTLIDAKNLDLYLEVRGEVVANLQLGQIIPVELDNRILQARLQALALDPDPLTSTHAIRIRLTDSLARPGMLAAAVLPLGVMREVQTIPVASVLSISTGADVFVYLDGRLSKTPIKLGARVGDRYVVRSGLPDDVMVVARDVAAMSDGQSVTLEQSS